MNSNRILDIFNKLLKNYGYQGWWPILSLAPSLYHKNDYSFPKDNNQIFEIISGAILTQNCNWKNASKAVENLYNSEIKSPEELLATNDNTISMLIKPAGYFNQKREYLKNISAFIINSKEETPLRKDLIKVKGVGNETADTILLYAYGSLEFVIDAYTMRMFLECGIVNEKDSYLVVKKKFEDNLPKNLKIYQEYHALIVEHGKRFYSKKPYGENDLILNSSK